MASRTLGSTTFALVKNVLMTVQIYDTLCKFKYVTI